MKAFVLLSLIFSSVVSIADERELESLMVAALQSRPLAQVLFENPQIREFSGAELSPLTDDHRSVVSLYYRVNERPCAVDIEMKVTRKLSLSVSPSYSFQSRLLSLGEFCK